MKKLLLFTATCFALSACETHKAELESSNQQRDSLLYVLQERDSTINDFLDSYNEIQVNLDSVAKRGNAINENIGAQGELRMSARERINQNIAAINDLMQENRAKVDELTRKLHSSNSKNGKLQKMIETLNAQIAQKDTELVALNEKLASLNANIVQLQTSVDTLTSTTAVQSQKIEEQTTALHTAFYTVGKSKELQEKKVIDKTGGLLGIGKSSRLNSNFDNSNFTRIDYSKTMSIPIDGKNVKLITAHPSDSYTLNKNEKEVVSDLQITNPDKFWSGSKYLVIVKD